MFLPAKVEHKKKTILEKIEKKNNDQKGSGKFLFRNSNKGDLILPKPALDGKRIIHPQETFLGDSYFKKQIGLGLQLVEVLEEESVPVKKEILLLEQPPVITAEGEVTYVKKDDNTNLNENPKKKVPSKKDLFLLEDK